MLQEKKRERGAKGDRARARAGAAPTARRRPVGLADEGMPEGGGGRTMVVALLWLPESIPFRNYNSFSDFPLHAGLRRRARPRGPRAKGHMYSLNHSLKERKKRDLVLRTSLR